MKQFFTLLACSLVLGASLVGCDSAGPDPKVEDNRLESATRVRELFDQTQGQYEKLSATEREELIKLFNGKEEDAKTSWDFMKNRGQGTSAPTGGRPSGGM